MFVAMIRQITDREGNP